MATSAYDQMEAQPWTGEAWQAEVVHDSEPGEHAALDASRHHQWYQGARARLGVIAAIFLGICFIKFASESSNARPATANVLQDIGDYEICYTHKINDEVIRTEPTRKVYDALYASHGGLSLSSSSLFSGSQTSDTLRYTTSDMPLCTKFWDGANQRHEVCILRESCQFTMFMPVHKKIKWQGDEEDFTYVDSLASVVQLEFSYAGETVWHSHGITVDSSGYGGAASQSMTQTELIHAMDVVTKAAAAGSDLASLVNTVAAL